MKKNKFDNSTINMIIIFGFSFIYFVIMIISMDAIGKYENPYVLYLINLFTIISSFISIIVTKSNYNKILKEKEIKEYEYYRNLDFKNISPTISGILLKKEKPNINTIITTIFELCEKNIVNIEVKNTKNYITLKEHRTEEIDKLLEYEKKILYLIFDNQQDTKEYCLNDIIISVKKDATTRYAFKKIEKEIKQYINKKFYSKFSDYIENMNSLIILNLSPLAFISLVLGWFPLIFALAYTPVLYILLIEYIIIIFLSIYYMKAKFLRKKYYEEIKKLNGLYTYMTDFTLLNEKELKFYQLYDKYYLYAMGLGLANKFENELNQNILNNNVRLAFQFYIQNKGELRK